ncbi:MAG: DUF2585 domain-containing protein [Sphingobium sp.]
MTGNRVGYLAAALVALAGCVILYTMGRPPICTCGTIELWHGAIDAGNSQHLSDWYSPSHFIHGLLFFGATWLLLRRAPQGWRLALAVAVEAAWEIAENSPFIIDRYRTATIALGYSGDSIVNSVSDIIMMTLGFLFAARVPLRVSIALGIALELLTFAVIRDNLILNIVMLVWPIDAIKVWQGG